MRHRELWNLIVEALGEYNLKPLGPAAVGSSPPPAPEDYIADTISQQFNLSPDEASFVRECFLGVLRYQKVCEGILQGFCDALKRNKQDRYSMYLIAYLMVYRFNEVGGRFLRSLMDKCTSATRLAEYVGFLLDESQMNTFAGPVLKQWYDDGYIEKFVIGSLQRHRPEAAKDVLDYYMMKATNPNLTSPSKMSDTEEDEEALMQRRDDAKATPSGSRTGASSKLSTTRLSTKEPTKAAAPKFASRPARQRDIEIRNLPPFEVREMLKTLPPEKPPKVEIPPDGAIPLDGPRQPRDPSAMVLPDKAFVETARPMHRERLMQEKKEREDAAYLPDPIMQKKLLPEEVREVYANARLSAPQVKLTTATIRREELLYRKRDQEKEMALLKKAQELRDDSEYQSWRKSEEDKAKLEREATIAERKLQLMISDEEAKAAKAKQEKLNLESAMDFRRTMTAWREAAAEEESTERQRKAAFAQNLRQECAEQTDQAVRQVLQEKRSAAEKIKEEKEQNELRAAALMELERQRKQILIQEIRELHQQSIAMRAENIEKCRDARLVDIGLINLMTTEELQQKIQEIRKEHSELEEQRREKIVNMRSNQRKELQDMLQRCELERQLYLDQKERDREGRRAAAAAHAEKMRVVEETRLIELQAKLQQKRDERKSISDKRKEEERQRKVEAMLLAGDAGAMEMKKWAEMERGVSNRIIANQNDGVRSLKQERTKQTLLHEQRETNFKETASRVQAARLESDKRKETKLAIAREDTAYDDAYRSNALAEMRKEKLAMRTRTA